MDLNVTGRHCALQSCNILDFLPIQCSCLEWFCRLHISPDLHNCASVQQLPQNPPSTKSHPSCASAGCDRLSLTTTADPLSDQGACPDCKLSFCVHHRHKESHSCTSLVRSDNTKHEAARAILAQKFQAAGTSAYRSPVVVRQQRQLPADSKKLAQVHRVTLMKLRHTAVPGDPKDRGSAIPVDQRLHLTVCLEITGQSTKESALWFRKTAITGRALDLTVQHFGVSHITSTFHLKKASAEIEGQLLENHLELSAQLDDGSMILLTDS